MIYLDTSAAVKLVRPEQHSESLSDWLRNRRGDAVLSSVLIEVELIRAIRRSSPDRLGRAQEVLRGVSVLALSRAVRDRAAGYADAALRSPDAIHLATAQHVIATTGQPLTAFVAYDTRLLEVTRNVGLPAVSPGTP